MKAAIGTTVLYTDAAGEEHAAVIERVRNAEIEDVELTYRIYSSGFVSLGDNVWAPRAETIWVAFVRYSQESSRNTWRCLPKEE